MTPKKYAPPRTPHPLPVVWHPKMAHSTYGGVDQAPHGEATPAQQPNEAEAAAATTSQRVHYAFNIDTNVVDRTDSDPSTDPSNRTFARSETQQSHSPIIRRRTRVGTFKTVDDFEGFEARLGWHRTFRYTIYGLVLERIPMTSLVLMYSSWRRTRCRSKQARWRPRVHADA